MSFILRLSVVTVTRAYLLCVALVTLVYGLMNVRIRSEFALGDWLINYAGGFVRRGLFGQCMLLLSRLHLPVLYVTLAVQVALYAVVWIFLWRMAAKYPWQLGSLALWLSPATLAFAVLNPPAGYRKEIVLFALLCGIMTMLRAGVSLEKVSLALTAGMILMLLLHEAFLLFLPYLLAPLLLMARDFKQFVKVSLLPVLAGVATFLLVFSHPGTVPQRQKICSAVVTMTHSRTEDLCGGAIGAIGVSRQAEHEMVIRTMHRFHYGWLYGATSLLGALPLAMELSQRARARDRRRAAFLAALGFLVVCLTVPLFVNAIDWGRWIFIHLFCALLLLLFAYASPQPGTGLSALPFSATAVSPSPSSAPPSSELSGVAKPTGVTLGDVLPRGGMAYVALAGLLAYVLLWTLPFYGGFPARSGYVGLEEYIRSHGSAHGSPASDPQPR